MHPPIRNSWCVEFKLLNVEQDVFHSLTILSHSKGTSKEKRSLWMTVG